MFVSSGANADADAEFKEALSAFTTSKSSIDDYKKSFEIGERLNQQGDCRGGYILGSIYANGFGVNKDSNKAKELLFQSANAGCAESASDIGYRYAGDLQGLGLPKDMNNAINWLSKSYEADINHNKKSRACYAAKRVAEIYYDLSKYSDSLNWYQKVQSGDPYCADDKTLAKIPELKALLSQQSESMREDPPVAGIRLSLGGEGKPTKKSKKKN